jgi:Aminotransferase class-V
VLWAEPPDRHEAGSPNVVGAVALGVVCRTLQAVGMAAIAAAEHELVGDTAERLAAIPGVRPLRMWAPGNPRIGVFPFRAKLFGADRGGGGVAVDEDLFTYMPYKIYPDATPDKVEDATFDEVIAEVVLDEDIISTDEVFARFVLINLNSDKRVSRDSPRVSVRL